MTKYNSLEEVKKDYPFLDLHKLTKNQKQYLLNNDIRSIDEDYNINCTNCTDCDYCVGCIDCNHCTDCTDCTDCINCAGCRNCNHCNHCNHCNDYTGSKDLHGDFSNTKK